MEYKVGDKVKVDRYGKWRYYIILEDNRPIPYCTNTFTLIAAEDYKIYLTQPYRHITVYCEIPEDIFPTNKTEKILFF